MGVVYKARDLRLERDVAIKVLRTTSKEEAARLEQEAKAAATLNHPGIVTVYDFEVGFDGYFIAMEYVPGEALDQLLKSDPGRIRANLRDLLVRLADAVAYAHRRHVIHRDLKPGNVLVTPDLDVKILDFGIAARLDSASGAAAGGVCGTPFYMAPEQIRGEVPTPATDIYAFGATAFHLATGRPPFYRGNVIDAHLKDAPPDPRDSVPDLHPELARIILRCLEKQPGERFQAADDLRDELLRLPDRLT
jgi:serine/threonine-protein kinase